ncbi:MAPEG family protein [Thalassococcus sp. BH17M4-6]|uniref:MAPEG family protein n=1 Tax=Thalassococcus sp. BH17M4-6 TaxID=3413148 RepID=UPI003BC5CEC5
MAPVTTLYASLIALLFLALSLRVVAYRRARQISLGDAGDPALRARIRAQGNCAEYAPIGLLLLLLVELQSAPPVALHVLGLLLLAGRVLHGLALSRHPHPMVLRVGGMILTFTMIGLAALGLLLHRLI